MTHYTHLQTWEREKIMVMLHEGKSNHEIALEIHRSDSTISREIKRNDGTFGYSSSKAQEQYVNRRKASHRHRRLDNPELFSVVKECFLDHKWSPEQISGYLKLQNPQMTLGRETIYRGIKLGFFNDPDKKSNRKGAEKYLRHGGRTIHRDGYIEKRGSIPISHPLEKRPNAANNRSRVGDWEADTVIGKKGKACLVTLVDRRTRYLLCCKADGKNSEAVNKAIISLLKNQPLHTITPDRGKEFARHKEVTAALNGVQFYFPPPHQPWKRGTNENTNGLLREYIPKYKDISAFSDNDILTIVDELNHRPRKCLGFKSPYDVYHSEILHLK